jgi:G3E family GTPase
MSEAARRPPPPFPLSVITGFLGAGKTTLLNKLLQDSLLADTLVIINEFGEIGLDHLLVEKVEGDMLLMSSGCLCCTIRGDLISTLEDLLRRFDNGRIKPFRRIIIETTGLADPAPILHTIMFHPYLMLRFRLEGVITLVDAVNGEATLDTQEEAVKQAAVADRIVLTKTDLASDREEEALRARLAQLNPAAPLLDAALREACAARLFDTSPYDPETKTADVQKWLNVEAFAAPHQHEHTHGHAHTHDQNRHDARIRAFCMHREEPIPVPAFDLFLELLRNAHGPHLLRVKGIVALADDPARPMIVHGVQHVFHPPLRLAAWPDADHTTRMVFILRDMEPAFVEGLWNAFAGVPALGQPDANALIDNPLAPQRGGLFS